MATSGTVTRYVIAVDVIFIVDVTVLLPGVCVLVLIDKANGWRR